MQMILRCMFAGKTNIICAHMGNKAGRDMKVARKNHEQGFNVGSPGNYSDRASYVIQWSRMGSHTWLQMTEIIRRGEDWSDQNPS